MKGDETLSSSLTKEKDEKDDYLKVEVLKIKMNNDNVEEDMGEDEDDENECEDDDDDDDILTIRNKRSDLNNTTSSTISTSTSSVSSVITATNTIHPPTSNNVDTNLSSNSNRIDLSKYINNEDDDDDDDDDGDFFSKNNKSLQSNEFTVDWLFVFFVIS